MPFKRPTVLSPIGFVETDAVGDEVKDKSRVSKIILNKELIEGLDGIEVSRMCLCFFGSTK